MRPVRREIQMIFQDPYSSLNPRRRVGSIIGDPFAIHKTATGAERKRQVQELMERVGLNPEHYNRFPAEFSGGQRQRIGVARALALRPQADHLRRAGVRARRVDPGAGAEPARRPAAGLRAELPVHRARPRGRPARQRLGGGHVPRAASASRGRRNSLYRSAAAPVHGRAAVRRAGRRPGRGGQPGSGSSWPGTCRPRSTRPPGAGSTRAARRHSSCAARPNPSLR